MTTANPHLRAIAIAGALAAVAMLLGSYTLSHRGGGTASDSSVSTTLPAITHPATAARPAEHAAAPAKPRHAATTTAAATTTSAAAPTKPHAAAKPKPKPKAPAGPAPAVVAALAYGLPKPVADQFASHRVVVVSLYSPSSGVDQVTEAEAQAGAALAGAGFAAVDVDTEGASSTLTRLLGVLDAPATLVFQRPDDAALEQFATQKAAAPPPRYPAAAQTLTPPEFKLFVTLTGYNDRQTVAQAALNADPDPGSTATLTPWAAGANALCSGAAARIAALGQVDSIAKLKQMLPAVHSTAASYLAGLAKLKAPAGKEAAVGRFRTLSAQDIALSEQLAAAAAKKDAPTVAMLAVKEDAVSRQVDALAIQLGATACAGGF